MATSYLTLEQAAERAGVTTDELAGIFSTGAVTGADQRWAIRDEDLQAWLATRT